MLAAKVPVFDCKLAILMLLNVVAFCRLAILTLAAAILAFNEERLIADIAELAAVIFARRPAIADS